MSRRNSSPRRMNLSPDVRGRLEQPYIPTEDEIRDMFGPAMTLAVPEDVRVAMDSQLADNGVYSLLQHSFQMGLTPATQFMGYGALQNIAQNGLIRACIETVADDMTRAWIELKREGTGVRTDENDELLTDLAHAADAFGLQRIFHEAAELVGYEGGAFIFIDTGADSEALETPLHIGSYSAELRPNRRLRLTVVDPVNVFPGDYDSVSPLSPHYFRPRWWWVMGQRIHASRLIRLVANEVPVLLRPAYNFLGIPQAQILWDYVLHFQECRAAAARLLTKFSLTVFKTKMADILFSAGGTGQLDARIRFMTQNMNNDGVLAIDKDDEDVLKLETPLSGVTDIVRQSLEILAALNRTPAVKLLGISPSGFNATGESDIRNYYDYITSQQEKVLRNGIRTVLNCLQLHLHGKIDSSVTFDFAPLGEEDRAALATLQKTKADTIAVYLDRDIIAPEEARKALADDPDSGFADIDPEAMPESNEMPDELMGETGAELDDVDKAGAVYDGALDAEEWRTAKNGKKYRIDTETGEVIKGNIGQKTQGGYASRPLESTAPDTARYAALLKEHAGDHQKAAHAYFREKLQGRHVEAQADKGTIQAVFTGGTWQELKRDIRKDALKAELVPHMPDIIAAGTHQKNDLHKARRDGATAFHEYRKQVETSAGPKEAIVDVMEREKQMPRYMAYNLTREGSKNYKDRQQKTPSMDSGPFLRMSGVQDSHAVNGKTIAPQFEVVNLRFADEQQEERKRTVWEWVSKFLS